MSRFTTLSDFDLSGILPKHKQGAA